MHSEFTPLGGVMKVVFPSNKPSKALVVPPITLIKEEEKAYAKGSYTTLKLRRNAAEENSLIYEIQVPYFMSGTCEQFVPRVYGQGSSRNHWTEFDYRTSESCVHADGFEG